LDRQNQSIQQRLVAFWARLGMPQRVGIIAVLVAGLAIALYAGVWSQSPDYATLFTGLSEKDAGSVVDELKAQKIPYRIGSGGAIQVPARQVYEVRLDMAKQGLPKGSTVGYELFDSGGMSNLGMTEFMQKINYQRALEGELARTVASLEPVESARVHIVIPEQSLYAAQDRFPSASVVLQLKPREELSREQVKAVTHLISSSVDGLKPTAITLVDMAGNVLATAGDSSSVPEALQSSTGHLEVQRAYEKDLETRLQLMMDQAVGPSHAIVRVNATFNWDQKQVNSETYSPAADGTGVVRSEQLVDEVNRGTGAGTGGVPGVDSNTQPPSYPASTITNTAGLQSAKKSSTRNYEVSKVVQNVTNAPGALQRLSVALLLDEAVPEDQSTRIKAMLTAAAGIDTTRGDALAVERIAFGVASAAKPAQAAATEQNQMLVNGAKLGGLLILLLILLNFARLTFRELTRRVYGDYVPQVTVVEEEMAMPMASRQIAESRAGAPIGKIALPASAASSDEKEQALLDAPVLPAPVVNPVRDQLMGMAQRRPELVADLIQKWLAESK
jgi:flagellar M-ring protein FliF